MTQTKTLAVIRKSSLLLVLFLSALAGMARAATDDSAIKLNSADGTTQFAIQNNAGSPVDVIQMNSLGGVNFSSNTVMPGTTFYQNMTASISSATIQLFPRSLATLQALTPTGTGILYYCTTCASTPICISTGTTLFGIASSSKTLCH